MASPLQTILSQLGFNAGGRSSSPQLPAYSAGQRDIMREVSESLRDINAAVRSGRNNWNDMARARALEPVRRTLRDLRDRQVEFNAAVRNGNATIEERVLAYDRLADATQEANRAQQQSVREINETQGAMGRFKNVVIEAGKRSKAVFAEEIVRSLKMMTDDANENFDIMARSGQLSFDSMSSASFNFTKEMRLSAAQSALMGISAEESNRSFAKLAETFGGTRRVVNDLSGDWFGMSQMARLSGLGMEGMADFMSSSFARLSEGREESLNNIAAMSKAVGEINGRFGEGKANVKEFSNAVQTLAFSTGFYNQNTKMVIESLSREIQVQLALGKSREDATKSAVANLKTAGSVNIIGTEELRSELLSGYQKNKQAGTQEQFLKDVTDKYGSAGETVALSLRSGELAGNTGAFLMQALAEQSTELQARIMEKLRTSPDMMNKALGYGLDLKQASLLKGENKALLVKMSDVATKGKAGEDALFKGGVKTDEQRKFVEALRNKEQPMSDTQKLKKFYEMGGVGDKDAEKLAKGLVGDDTDARPEWRQFVDGQGQAWYLGITNSMNALTEALKSVPFVGAAGALATGMAGKWLARQALGSAAGQAGTAAGAGGAGAGGASIGLMGAGALASLPFQAMGWVEGWQNAANILGKAEKDLSIMDRLSAGAGSIAEMFFGQMGVTAEKWAKAETGFQQKLGSLMESVMPGSDAEDLKYKMFMMEKKAGRVKPGTMYSDWVKSDPVALQVLNADADYSNMPAVTVPGKAGAAATAAGTTAAGTSSTPGGAVALGSVSGNSLFLEVQNWPSIMAQSIHANENST